MTVQTLPIDLYTWGTPNGFKASIMLEELDVPYATHFVNIGKGEQLKPEFLAISPNNRIPAIVDPEGPGGKPISVFESGAILQYLGRKFGQLYPTEERARVAVEEWLMWQMGGVGPMFGQLNHFRNYAVGKIPYAIDRYLNETHRLYRVLEKQLGGRDYVAGDYSIADIALFGWIRNWESRGVDIAEFPNVKAWHDRVDARPAVQRGLKVKAPTSFDLSQDKDAQKILFGQR
ncbi:MAG: glutathione S-transferase N-terminal domain-containing protein [Rhizobiales bacterium]|nr:glutathione S-transferase N-terminal domain-containing protein [Hyphomicrobiales bacterium]